VWGSGVNDCDYVRFFGEGHIFRRNYLHGTKEEEIGPAHVDGWQTYAVNPGEYAKDILIDGNILTDHFMHGVMMEGRTDKSGTCSAEGIRIINNVFAGGVSTVTAFGGRLIIANNTFVRVRDVGMRLEVNEDDDTPTSAVVVNNIFYDSFFPYRPLRKGEEVGVYRGCSMKAGRNLIFSTSFSEIPPLYAPDDILNTDPCMASPQNLVGSDGKPFTRDDGYLLKETSPCIDAGFLIEEMTGTKDICGAKRVVNSRIDIGAHEFAPMKGGG